MSFRLIPFHAQPHPDVDVTQPFVVASLDPGTRSFAVRVERRVPGAPPAMLLYVLVSFGGKAAMKAAEEDDNKVLRVWGLVLSFLDSIADVLAQVNLYIFEQQLSPNHSVAKMSQHVMCAIMCRFRDRPPFPVILEVSPQLKSPLIRERHPEAKGKELKKHAPEAARQLLEARGDERSLAIMREHKKKDDLSDVVLQIEALVRLLGQR